MGKFYEWHSLVKWSIAIAMLLIVFSIMGLYVDFSGRSPLIILAVFLIVPFFQFLAAPFFTLTKMYQYLSPMLLVYSASGEKYDLHNGTSFDYLMHMRGLKPGIQWRKKLLSYFLEGILVIIQRIEKGELPNTVIVRGSSYFFSESTAKRMGFEISNTSIYEKMNLLFNYLDLLWMFSLSKGKLTFPKLSQIKTASITGSNLVKNKKYFEELNSFLIKAG